MKNHFAVQMGICALFLAGCIWLGYFTPRTSFTQLFFIYLFLFGLYLLILKGGLFNSNIKMALVAALVFRLSLLLMMPNLSDDYFRFIWDGLLSDNGYNPYLVLPSEFIKAPGALSQISPALYEGLNSPDYYSVYPPVCQYIFSLSARLNSQNVVGNVILIRLVILLAECGSIAVLYRLATKLKLPPSSVFIYAFNPLVIMELTGNLHFEAVMVFFLLLAMYFLTSERLTCSAVSFALAAGTKLIPLIFLPLLLKRLGAGKGAAYLLLVSAASLMLFLPFLSLESISGFLTGLSLYFQKFEFNASIYFLVRWLGYQFTGFNIIAFSGLLLAAVSLLSIAIITLRQGVTDLRFIFIGMLFCLTVLYVFATTVHPWYLTTLIALSVFTRYKYALLWSFLAVLSYSAYQSFPYSENLWLVTAEYLLAGGWLLCEILARPAPVGAR